MRTLSKEGLADILRKHEMWLNGEEGGERADLEYADLSGADLSGADLRGAYLEGVNLSGANLSYANFRNTDFEDANLSGANLSYANLRDTYLEGANFSSAKLSYVDLGSAYLEGANLARANLSGANLSCTNLNGANLERACFIYAIFRGANLKGANLEGADFEYANLSVVDISDKEKHRLGTILKEPIIGYKKCRHGVIVTLEIPEGAIVFCINGKECRTNKAKVVSISNGNIALSSYSKKFQYRVGDQIEIDNFNLMYNIECASGIHFFKTREEAEKYKL